MQIDVEYIERIQNAYAFLFINLRNTQTSQFFDPRPKIGQQVIKSVNFS